jgi:hypothetical protein
VSHLVGSVSQRKIVRSHTTQAKSKVASGMCLLQQTGVRRGRVGTGQRQSFRTPSHKNSRILISDLNVKRPSASQFWGWRPSEGRWTVPNRDGLVAIRVEP